jgi:hypothetical protein
MMPTGSGHGAASLTVSRDRRLLEVGDEAGLLVLAWLPVTVVGVSESAPRNLDAAFGDDEEQRSLSLTGATALFHRRVPQGRSRPGRRCSSTGSHLISDARSVRTLRPQGRATGRRPSLF